MSSAWNGFWFDRKGDAPVFFVLKLGYDGDMPRGPRCCPAGTVFHCLNRAVTRLTLFEKEGDYIAFETVLEEAWERTPIRILDYVVMPNHWHFVLWPETDTEVTEFLRWLTNTHTMRWHAHYGTSGTGHLYQGRFKSFPVESDEHLYTLLRYVQRNPVRAELVERVEQWRYGSAWRREHGKAADRKLLSTWPIPRSRTWLEYANEPQSEAELDAIGNSLRRGAPFGSPSWISQTAARLSLGDTLRPRGQPKKQRS